MPCIPLFEDNEGAIQIAKHPISNSNSKHIDVRHHFLRELVERKRVGNYPRSFEIPGCGFSDEGIAREGLFVFHRDYVMNLKQVSWRRIFLVFDKVQDRKIA
ncbi:unnamed protein product [Scytosiphon promiscuus]